MSAVLTLNNVAKAYGKVRALKGVSFEVPQGSIFGILGPNGSGKTTLLSIVLDVLKANKGDFHWFGIPGSPEQRRKIGSLLETPNFYHYMSGRDNLKVTQTISGRGKPSDNDEVLKKEKLIERRKSKFSSYSLGMKQRLAIAAALLGAPKVLVLDEPTNGLDPVGIAEIRELMVELRQQGHTIIMASHLLDEVEKICTHVAILKTGDLVTTGLVEDVLSDEDIVELGAADLQKLLSVMKEISNSVVMDEKTRILQISMAKGSANLETRFFELTNN